MSEATSTLTEADIERIALERAAEVEAAAPEPEKPPERHPLDSLTLDECSARRFRRPPPELPMVLDKLGFRGMPAVIAGLGGVGKTTLELQMAASIATGKAFLGDNIAPCVQGSVLILLPEDPEIPTWQRMYNLAEALGADADALERIFCPDVYGTDLRCVVKGPRGLETTPAFDALVDFAKRIPDLALIILDPLSLLQDCDLESSPGAAQYFASRMAYLARETNTLVLVAHHSVKGLSSSDNFDLEKALHQDTVRGSGGIVNGFRAALTLATLPQQFAKKHLGLDEIPRRGEYLAGLVPKFNYAPKGDVFILRRDEKGVLWPVDTGQSKRAVQKIEKAVTLARVIPQIVAEVAAQEVQDKRFTMHTFARVYSKEWKSTGNDDASKSTLTAAIERALVDGHLCIEMLPRENGKDAPYLTAKGALPLPPHDDIDDPDTWINGLDSCEVEQ